MSQAQPDPQAQTDPHGLAEYLKDEGRISEEEYSLILTMSRGMEDPVRLVLVATDIMTWEEVYQTLAEIWGLPFIDLDVELVDENVAQQLPVKEAVKGGVLPFRFEGKLLSVAATEPLSDSLKRRLLQCYEEADQIKTHITEQWTLDLQLSRAFDSQIHREAVHGQWERAPKESAFTVLTRRQYAMLGAGTFGTLGLAYLYPQSAGITLSVLISLFFVAQVSFKLWASLGGGLGSVDRLEVEETSRLSVEECPSYTILVPLYKEANVVEDLIAALLRLDYPKTKLEILILLEEEDRATIDALRSSDIPDYVRPIVVPPGVPQTKPRACNVGLWFSRGEHLVIYDAEDRPEADQIRKAATVFRKSSPKLACIQCALNYYNAEENFLTRMFTLEYTYWFDYLLPGLMARGLPIPLGGTSNHFRTDALEEVGGWDPFNVTEDADLGIRIVEYGYETQMLASTTYEEANNSLGNWIRQRSRWLKGYMQTALVHTRHPIELIRKIGFYETAGFGMMVWGSPIALLLSPIMWGFFILWILTRTQVLDPYFPPPMLWVPLLGLIWGNMLAIYLNLLASFRRGLYHLTIYSLLNPVYWLLMSAAAYKALTQLFYKPFYWEKTRHGLTDHDFTS